MKITAVEAVNMHRISLQIDSKSNNKNNSTQNRASMCYSANLKKRTVALHAQRVGLEHFLQQPHMIGEMPTNNCKLLSNSCEKSKSKSRLINSAIVKNRPNICKTKNLQKIEVNPINLQLKGSHLNTNTNCNKNQNQNKDMLVQYGTINTQIIQNSSSKNLASTDFLQTCPEFKEINNNKQQKSTRIFKKPKQSDLFSSIQLIKNNSNTIPNKQAISPQFLTKNKSQNFNENSTKIVPINSRKQQNIKHKNQSNRLVTAPSRSSRKHMDEKAKFKIIKSSQKQLYKTNQINLSKHFTNTQQKNSIFPNCKKMSISSINKYYELCIEQVKRSDIKKKLISQSQPLKTAENMKTQSQFISQVFYQQNKSYRKQKGLQKIENSSSKINTSKKINQKSPTKVIKTTKTTVDSFLTATKIKKQIIQQNQVWLQIRNTLDDEQKLSLTMCSKKQLVERANLIGLARKSLFTQKCNILKQDNQAKNKYLQAHHSYEIRKNTIKAIKTQNNKKQIKESILTKTEDDLAAWYAPAQGYDTNFNNDSCYNL